MKDIKVIEPDARKKDDLECPVCEMKYSQAHYKILKSAKKLTYFRVPDAEGDIEPVCHFCLRDVVMRMNDNQPTEVTIISKTKTINHTFYGDNGEN